jgi:hypothetical protein
VRAWVRDRTGIAEMTSIHRRRDHVYDAKFDIAAMA